MLNGENLLRLDETHHHRHPFFSRELVGPNIQSVMQLKFTTQTNRTFRSAKTARKRIAGKPFNLKRISPGNELWVYDAAGHLYQFGKPKRAKKVKRR